MNNPKHIRKQIFGMTQQQFANALGRTQPSVCEWEAKGHFPTAVISKVRELGVATFGTKWRDAYLFEPPKQESA